ncbi:MAG: hypothetical protein EOO90_03795 [Pedobacter sp.]|nr:MAG: hypothetical protein EOO90_03795 [Pedobacter sp.]
MNYTILPKVIIRTPLKPLRLSFSEKEVLDLFTMPDLIDALYLSSPILLKEYQKFTSEGGDSKRRNQLILSLAKYALRLHNRCTPFGLMAGCGVFNISKSVEVYEWSRKTNLDMNYVFALSQELSKIEEVRSSAKFVTNNSIYSVGNEIRYVEYFYKKGKRIYQISSIQQTEYLMKVLDLAKNGETIVNLAQALAEDDSEIEEARLYIEELVDSQLLISLLEPSVLGTDSLGQIMDQLSKEHVNANITGTKPLQCSLKQIVSGVLDLDKIIGNPINLYELQINMLSGYNVPIQEGKIFQTDMFVKFRSPEDVIKKPNQTEELLRLGARILNKLRPHKNHSNLQEFAKRFQARYEDQEVPLLIALDNEFGIGYADANYASGDINPLVDDFELLSSKKNTFIEWNKRESFLLKKLIGAQRENQTVVELLEDDLKDFNEDWTDYPATMFAFYNHLGNTEVGETINLKMICGPSGINLIGRFASKNKEILEIVQELASHEQNLFPNAILAEISHLPQSRIGNVVSRPSFRDYEIPYLSKSNLDNDNVINLDDLYISVRNQRIQLFSKRLRKIIIPRLGSAHAYSHNSLPVYHFLCDMQSNNISTSLQFDWGSLKGEFKFLPRVVIKNVILSPARWTLTRKDFDILIKPAGDLLSIAQNWKIQQQLPTLFLVREQDNELLIDLDNELSVKLLISIVRKKHALLLEEFLFTNENFYIKGRLGSGFTNEIIAFFKKNVLPDSRSFDTQNSNSYDIKRKYSLGSEWLSFKLFCGVKNGDNILLDVFKPLIDEFLSEELIDKWFFIRYYDNDYHLRIRLHLVKSEKIGEVIDRIYENISQLENDGSIWRVQSETYNRELERYSALNITEIETMFFYDSRCIIEVLPLLASEEERWIFALCSAYQILDLLQESEEGKLIQIQIHRDAFANEFNLDKFAKVHFDTKYRRLKSKISAALLSNDVFNSDMIFPILSRRTNGFKKILSRILETEDINRANLASSLIHMTINRIFRSKNRLNEAAIYELLWRFTKSAKFIKS